MNGMANTFTVPYVSAWTINQMNDSNWSDSSAVGCLEMDEIRAIDWCHRMEELIAAVAKNRSR